MKRLHFAIHVFRSLCFMSALLSHLIC